MDVFQTSKMAVRKSGSDIDVWYTSQTQCLTNVKCKRLLHVSKCSDFDVPDYRRILDIYDRTSKRLKYGCISDV